ncbi:MAG: hypothetical protein KC501_41000 [Myxococcales bacterium]|nr:hypothetical protein [Myxococcales bacterium]
MKHFYPLLLLLPLTACTAAKATVEGPQLLDGVAAECTECVLPEVGTPCQAIAYLGEAVCEPIGGDCWATVAAQYEGGDVFLEPAIAKAGCENDCASVDATCATVPEGFEPTAQCTAPTRTQATCAANALAVGLSGPTVDLTCQRLVQ